MTTKLSIAPCDKKFRQWITKEIKDIFAESDTMEEAERMLIHVVNGMLKEKQSVWVREQ